jgi:hypothetical protein
VCSIPTFEGEFTGEAMAREVAMKSVLLDLLSPGKLGAGVISPDGQVMVIPLLSRGEHHSDNNCDILTALNDGADVDFNVSSMSSFEFTNNTKKTVVFPVGSVISGGKHVQDRVLTAPALCPPGCCLDFGEALCGNITAHIVGDLERRGLLLPVGMRSGNPLIQPSTTKTTPKTFIQEADEDNRSLMAYSHYEIEHFVHGEKYEAGVMEYLLETSRYFMRNLPPDHYSSTDRNNNLRYLLEKQMFDMEEMLRAHRENIPMTTFLERTPLVHGTAPPAAWHDMLSQTEKHPVYHSSHVSRRILETRESFARQNESLQSRMWAWIRQQPEMTPSAFELLLERKSGPSKVPPLLQNCRKREVGLLVVGKNNFAMHYLPDEEAWSRYREHFLTSFFDGQNSDEEGPVDFVEIADDLLDSLRSQIAKSDEPGRVGHRFYNVDVFTDGLFKAWGIEDNRFENAYQFVALHGLLTAQPS